MGKIGSLLGKPITSIRIPLSGSVWLSRQVAAIIDTKYFQRLKGTRQLGPLYNVFPGAVHTRAEHSLGTFHLAEQFLYSLQEKAMGLSDEQAKVVLLAALLHDIGHPPFSHALDGVRILGFSLPRHEEVGGEMICGGELARKIRALGVEPGQVAEVIVGKGPLADFLHAAFNVDRLDFLRRDSHHSGVPYGLSVDIDRLRLSLGRDEKGLYLNRKAKEAFATLVVAHRIMYEAVYHHKVSTALQGMIRKALVLLVEKEVLKERDLKALLQMTDLEFTLRVEEATEKLPPSERKVVRRLLSPLRFGKREIVKLVGQVEGNVNPQSLEEKLEERTGQVVIVERVEERGFSPEEVRFEDGVKPEVEFPGMRVVRVYAFEEAKEKVERALREMVQGTKDQPRQSVGAEQLELFPEAQEGGELLRPNPPNLKKSKNP